MNFIGKLFVMLYGTASLFCLILATAVYTQKMNFVTPKGEDPKKLPPLVEKSIEKTKQLLGANNRAYTRWVQNADELAKLEVAQFQRREFYSGQLELAQTGQLDGKEVKDPPIQIIELDPAGLKQSPPSRIVSMDKPPNGWRPEEVRMGVAAKPPHFYSLAIDAADQEKVDLQKQIHELAQKTKEATEVTNGTEMPFVKGLRARIKEQEHIAKIADEERIYLDNPITTRRAEALLFVKRRDALESRIARLQKIFGMKQGGQGN